MKLDLSTSTRALGAWLRSHPGAALVLDEHMSSLDLIALCQAHEREPHAVDVYEAAARHPSADADLLGWLMQRPDASSQLQNVIVTSGHATRDIISELEKSPYPSVREHAAIARVSLDLDQGTTPNFRDLLRAAAGDKGVGMRWTLARHPRTPLDVLEELRQDEADVVADAAAEELTRRSPI